MKYVRCLTLAACLAGTVSAGAQVTGGKSMTVDDLAHWQRIIDRSISNDGKWVACKMAPWEGDATVFLYASGGKEVATFSPAGRFAFSASSDYLVVTEMVPKTTLDSLKIKKIGSDKMPMDRLVIYSVSGKRETIDSLRSFRLAAEADWIAYQKGRKDSRFTSVRSRVTKVSGSPR